MAEQQREVSQEARAILDRLQEMMRTLEQNRMLQDAERRRFNEEVSRPLEELAEERLPRSAAEIGDLPRTGQPDRSIESARSNVQEIAGGLRQVADRLATSKKFREILNRLQLIIQLQEKVIEETGRGIDD